MSEYEAYVNELNNPYNKGVDAYYNGPYDSPYDEGTPEWEAWCDGWDASADSDGSGLHRWREEKEDAYEQGKCAAYDATNPYLKGTLDYDDWERGWSDGED